jgi:hypothetical protein
MTAKEILALISTDDNSDLAQAARADLGNGGPCLLGLDIQDGHVTMIITQPKDASTAPFEIESNTYRSRMPGVLERTIKIRRSSMSMPILDPDLTKPAWPDRPTRGGAREGSGRKPDPDKRVILSCRVKQPTLRLLKETAEETGTGLGAVVDFIVEDYKRRTDAE